MPCFQIYFPHRIRALRGKEAVRGLDKILPRDGRAGSFVCSEGTGDWPVPTGLVHDFKYQAGAGGSARLRSAVHIAGRIQNEIAGRMEAVGADSELVDYSVTPAASGSGRQLEESSASSTARTLRDS